MKVLYVTDGVAPWVIGGMQAVARRHIAWLHDFSFDVTAVTSRADMPSRVDFASRLINLRWPVRPALAKLDPWNYVRQLEAYSVQVGRVIDQATPDLIYSEGPFLSALLARPLRSRTPLVFHTHGLEMFQKTGCAITDARLWPLRSLMRRHAAEADVILSQGGRLDKILRDRLRVSRERMAYLPNCAPVDFRSAQRPRAGHQNRFLFVGRDEAPKGLSLLLSAAAAVPHARFDIVGARRPGCLAHVTCHGPIRDRNRVRAAFDAADFLVVPSYSEGMPTVIFEAFSAGLPVIATDVGAIRALVRDGETGFLVTRGDRAALAATLERAMALSAPAYANLSRRALELARTTFSPTRVRDRFLEIISSTYEAAACRRAVARTVPA